MTISLGLDGYCQLADVQRLLKQRTISASSVPSSDDVEDFIKLVFAEINPVLARRGYRVPVVDQGNHLIIGGAGTLKVDTAALQSGEWVILTPTTGSLAGFVRKGDAVKFAGHTQAYVAIDEDEARDDDTVTFYNSPILVEDVAADEAVTYHPQDSASEFLRQLNALGAAAIAEASVYSTGATGPSQQSSLLEARYKRLLDSLEKGRRSLLGAYVDTSANRAGVVRVVRTT